MKLHLTPQQREELRKAMLSGNFDIEIEITRLVDCGHSREDASQLILTEVNIMKHEAFDENFVSNSDNDYRKLSSVAAIFLTMIGAIFDVESITYYVVSSILAWLAGYFGYKSKPIAGAFASAALVLLFPFMFKLYLAGRTSHMKIEILIPLLMSALVSFFIYWIVSKMIYNRGKSY